MSLSTTGPAADPPGGPDARPDARPGGPSDGGWLDTFRSLPKPLRITTYVCLVLVLVLLVALAAGVVLVRRPFPQIDGTIDLPGLSAPVTVLRDGHGIPQVYADNLHDLFYAQGYVAAQDRFFEMDVRRHITAGRLSEMFGSTTLETDEYVRTMGWRRVAERELPRLQPRTRGDLQAYTDGVNAYLDTHSLSHMSLEYTLLEAGGLDYHPEQWTPVDSLAWLKAMAWDLRGNMDDEIDRVLDLQGHTRAQVDELYPRYPYGRTRRSSSRAPSSTASSSRTRPGRGAAEPRATGVRRGRTRARCARWVAVCAHLPQLLGHGGGIGTNSWVVYGDHTDDRQAAPGQRPAPRRRACPASGTRWACTATTSAPTARSTSPASRSPGVPGRGDRPQRRHRLGVHQPRTRRVRPLPREGPRQPVAVRRPLAAAARAPRDDPGRRRAPTSRSPCGRPRTARSSPTSPPSCATSARRRRWRPPAERTPSRWRGPAPRRRAPRTRSSTSTRRPTGRRSASAARAFDVPGAEPRVRRPGRPHRLPGAGPDPDPPAGQRRALAVGRLAAARTTGPAATSRSGRCRACSTRRTASWSPRTRR